MGFGKLFIRESAQAPVHWCTHRRIILAFNLPAHWKTQDQTVPFTATHAFELLVLRLHVRVDGGLYLPLKARSTEECRPDVPRAAHDSHLADG